MQTDADEYNPPQQKKVCGGRFAELSSWDTID